MGARINYVFKDSEAGPSVVLYSHWGQDGWEYDITAALEHSRPRWQDSSYATRMMISHLIQHSVLEETGFGIYAINNDNWDLGEQTVVIDFTNNTITDNVPVTFDNFIMAYKSLVYNEQIAKDGSLSV
jgi:hypothetical protein